MAQVLSMHTNGCAEHLVLWGTWCSGITSASHAEGPGFKSQCVHLFGRGNQRDARGWEDWCHINNRKDGLEHIKIKWGVGVTIRSSDWIEARKRMKWKVNWAGDWGSLEKNREKIIFHNFSKAHAWSVTRMSWDDYRSHFGSRYKLGCCGHAGLFILRLYFCNEICRTSRNISK